MNPVTYIIVNGGIVVLIYIGALRVDMGNLTQGEVVALINYMSQILVELVKLANLIISVTKAVACGNRIESVLKIKPDMESGNLLWEEVIGTFDQKEVAQIPYKICHKLSQFTSLHDQFFQKFYRLHYVICQNGAKQTAEYFGIHRAKHFQHMIVGQRFAQIKRNTLIQQT